MQGTGYLVSIFGVFLLAVPALNAAGEIRGMAICLALGMAASIAGMAIRWIAHRRQELKIREVRREARGAAPHESARAA